MKSLTITEKKVLVIKMVIASKFGIVDLNNKPKSWKDNYKVWSMKIQYVNDELSTIESFTVNNRRNLSLG